MRGEQPLMAGSRYRLVARWYDLVSLERPVYRRPRLDAVAALDLRPGDRVLDLGCGTGLNLPHLLNAVGPSGSVVGVDRSPQMLARARARSRRNDRSRVDLLQADATSLTSSGVGGERRPYDAAIATYALSLMPGWTAAWDLMLSVVRPGGRIAVVDLGIADTGLLARGLSRLACRLGGSDPTREPGREVQDHLTGVHRSTWWAGHVLVRVGTVPAPPNVADE